MTGSRGFLGTHVMNYFKKKANLMGLTSLVHEGDSLDKGYMSTSYSLEQLKETFRKGDVVIHLAAERERKKKDVWMGNVERDYNVLSAALERDVNLVIFISSMTVYGDHGAPWTELDPLMPKTAYALQKEQSESTAKFFAAKGLPIVTLRIPSLFGDGERVQNAVSTFLRLARNREQIEVWVEGLRREYLFVEDVPHAINKIIDSPFPGTYNLGSGEALSPYELAALCLSGFKRDYQPKLSSQAASLNELYLMNSGKFRRVYDWTPTRLKDASIIVGEKGVNCV